MLVPSRQGQGGVPIRLGRLEWRAGSGQAALSGGCYIQNEDLNPGSQNEGLFSMFTYNTVMLLTKNNAATWVYCSQNNYRIYKEKSCDLLSAYASKLMWRWLHVSRPETLFNHFLLSSLLWGTQKYLQGISCSTGIQVQLGRKHPHTENNKSHNKQKEIKFWVVIKS